MEPVPDPTPSETPTAYADRVARWMVACMPVEHRKQQGIYPTTVQVAEFMAQMVTPPGHTVRLLDPGAGTGILACACCEHLARSDPKVTSVTVDAFEIDPHLIRALQKVFDHLVNHLGNLGINVTTSIHGEDFILRHANSLTGTGKLFADSGTPTYDIVIGNPPYFKLAKSDPRAQAAHTVVHGQPNIYALFMAIGAALLRQGGQFVFITPRSFTSGPYFRTFRDQFFSMMRPVEVHVFDSRKDAFKGDDVLQENVILHAVREDGWAASPALDLAVTASRGGSDLETRRHFCVPSAVALVLQSRTAALRLPTVKEELEILEFVDAWPASLHSLGLEISTGPVVPFRATHLLAFQGSMPSAHAPLLWMQHVHSMAVRWPNGVRKEQYISLAPDAGPLLVADRNYVLIRRFSAKEQQRRLTAAPLLAGQLGSPVIGLENHLNYVHRPGGSMGIDEAWGIAAIYNSSIMDTYFRVLNGNTQVSATELRSMPLPDHATIDAIGAAVQQQGAIEIDRLVADMVGFGQPHEKVRSANGVSR